jgi:molybdate transport system substrate-binding protein
MVLLVVALPLRAAEIEVLSAGAVEPGLEPAVQAFRSASSQAVHITYATAPRILEQLASGEAPDLLIAPQSLIEGMTREGKLAGEPMTLGRIGVGMVVRPGVPVPVVEDAEGLRRAVLQAPTLVYNRASTGMYLDRLFERMGLAAAVAPKALRYPTGADVMEHLLRGSGQELGFGAISEIRMVRELRYVGPLPPDVQSYTTYRAALLPGAPVAAEALLRWISGAEARAAFESAGIEPAPR